MMWHNTWCYLKKAWTSDNLKKKNWLKHHLVNKLNIRISCLWPCIRLQMRFCEECCLHSTSSDPHWILMKKMFLNLMFLNLMALKSTTTGLIIWEKLQRKTEVYMWVLNNGYYLYNKCKYNTSEKWFLKEVHGVVSLLHGNTSYFQKSC